jgi:hypothetical protein
MNGIINIARRQASSSGGAAPVNFDFVSTWDTTQAGSASDTVVLPLLVVVRTLELLIGETVILMF